MFRITGFSIIEISVVLLIVALLVSLSLPNYQPLFAKTKNLQSKETLIELAAALEHYYVEYGTYQGASLAKLGFHTEGLRIKELSVNHYKISLGKLAMNDMQSEPFSEDDS